MERGKGGGEEEGKRGEEWRREGEGVAAFLLIDIDRDANEGVERRGGLKRGAANAGRQCICTNKP